MPAGDGRCRWAGRKAAKLTRHGGHSMSNIPIPVIVLLTLAASAGCTSPTQSPPETQPDAPTSRRADTAPPSANGRPVARALDEVLLFRPARYPAGDWQPKELRFEDVWFTAEDGTRLHGWYCPREGARAVLLYAHG